MGAVTDASGHDRTARLRARGIYAWARTDCRGRPNGTCQRDQATNPVEEALAGLESDLSYLEELPAVRLAPSREDLGEAVERLVRLVASSSPA
jgi:hypothetical protein